MATKNIGRDEDEHFDSLTLLVLKFGMEGLSRTEENRLSYLKYLETVFKMNKTRVPHLLLQPFLLNHCMYLETILRMTCAGSRGR